MNLQSPKVKNAKKLCYLNPCVFKSWVIYLLKFSPKLKHNENEPGNEPPLFPYPVLTIKVNLCSIH